MKKQSDEYKIDSTTGQVYIERDGNKYYYSSQGEFLKSIFNNNLETYKQSITDTINNLSQNINFEIRED